MIEGVLVTPLKRIGHPKGDLFHVMKKSSIGYNGFGEAYISTILKDEIKGWKKHHVMTLNLVVPQGAVKVVIFDERDDSATKGEYQEIVLSVENYSRLTIPPNLWVAFQGASVGVNMLLNIANIEHDPDESSDFDLNELPYSWGPNH